MIKDAWLFKTVKLFQGMVKRRVQPEDVIINCSKDSVWPKPPEGHQWKEVRHDNTVSISNIKLFPVSEKHLYSLLASILFKQHIDGTVFTLLPIVIARTVIHRTGKVSRF